MSAAERFDFFNPFMSARIIVDGPNGTKYPFWTSAGPGQPFSGSGGAGDPLNGLKALSFVSEITVDLPINGPPNIRVVLTPPYEDAIKFLDSALVEYGFNFLEVQFGYAKVGQTGARLSNPFVGRVKSTEVSFGPDVTITLNAMGAGGALTSDQVGAGKTYTGTRLAAITEICERCGWTVKDDLAQKDADTSRLLGEPANKTQAWATDLYMLQTLAKDCHAVFRFLQNDDSQKGVVELIPISTFWAKGTIEHVFSLFAPSQQDLGSTVYPILSATTPFNAQWIGGVRKMILAEVDEKKKISVTKTYGHDDMKDATSAPNGAADTANDTKGATQKVDESSNAGMQHLPGDPGDAKYFEQLKGALHEYKASGWGIPLTIETIGVPTLLPGMAVGVRGLGMRLDTKSADEKMYTVHKITHTYNASGPSTRLEMVANTGGYVSQQITKAPAGPTPTPGQPEGDNADHVTGGK